jgi:hypothetical protein
MTPTYARIDAMQAAHGSGDFREFLPAAEELLSSDVVLSNPEDSSFPDAGMGEWHRHEGFLRFIGSQTEGFGEVSIEPQKSSTGATRWSCRRGLAVGSATPA